MTAAQSLRWSAMTACIALLLFPASARAQDPDPDSRPPIDLRVDSANALSRFQRRFSGHIAVVQMRPVGELATNIGFGYGIDGGALMRLDDAGIFALRAGLGIVQYGSEHERVPLSSTIGGRITVDVTTTNDVWMGGLGAQLMAPSGWIRPYVSGSAGFASFITESSLQGSSSGQDFASTTNHQDTGFAWQAGGGVYIPIHRGRSVVSLDLGATYNAPQGKRSYLKPGSIRDLPNGDIAIDPMYSEAKFVTWRIGVSVGRE